MHHSKHFFFVSLGVALSSILEPIQIPNLFKFLLFAKQAIYFKKVTCFFNHFFLSQRTIFGIYGGCKIFKNVFHIPWCYFIFNIGASIDSELVELSCIVWSSICWTFVFLMQTAIFFTTRIPPTFYKIILYHFSWYYAWC